MPLKIKTFLWFTQQGVISTKHNLTKSNWTGIKKILFFIVMRQLSIYFCQPAKAI
jgi:chemotaxis methyl-accepting protein methylase